MIFCLVTLPRKLHKQFFFQYYHSNLKYIPLIMNYRGITVTTKAANVYNAQLRNCIEPKAEKMLRKNQNGFLRN